jgi:CarD family transcriptional regulator
VGWRRSSRPPNPTSPPSTESARAPKTSAKGCAGSRRSTWSTGTCRADGDDAVQNRKEPPIPELEEAIEEVFEDVEYVCDFEEGDKVVYPHHGAGLVMTKETRELMGEKREYLTIKILHNELTVMVPCENAGKAGLRRVIDEEEIKKVTTVLTDDVSEMPKNWNRRFKYNREKIKTGDVFELAEVVRNLAIREMEKGLSTGEKQMYTRAKKILASEFMYALDKDEEGAEEYLDGLLEERFAATA